MIAWHIISKILHFVLVEQNSCILALLEQYCPKAHSIMLDIFLILFFFFTMHNAAYDRIFSNQCTASMTELLNTFVQSHMTTK